VVDAPVPLEAPYVPPRRSAVDLHYERNAHALPIVRRIDEHALDAPAVDALPLDDLRAPYRIARHFLVVRRECDGLRGPGRDAACREHRAVQLRRLRGRLARVRDAAAIGGECEAAV